MPLYNNINPYFVFLDGIYYLYKSTLLTVKDLQQNENEKVIAVSEPECDKNKETYSSFKTYSSLLNNQDLIISKISSFNISYKLYNIYQINQKDYVNKNLEGRLSQIKLDEEEFQNTKILSRNNKSDKIQLIEDNASVASQQTGSNNGGGISNLGIRNKKGDNNYECGKFKKIRLINIILILIGLIILIFQYVLFIYIQKTIFNNDISLLEFNEFTRIYFQLFSSIINIVCLDNFLNCMKITDIFIDNYKKNNVEYKDDFDYTELILNQNILFAERIMEKKNNLVNIHKTIGNNDYNKLFGKKIKFYRITQNIVNNKNYYNLTSVNMQFSEAILVMCNSFQILCQENDNLIFFLSGKDDPFNFINEYLGQFINLNDYQKNFYEMIFNYKYYYEQFNNINDQLQKKFNSVSKTLSYYISFYLTLNTILILFITSLTYIYTIYFELLLMKIINYINMIMNVKNDEFNFTDVFFQKIENLETILQFYNNDPIKTIL